MQQHNTDMIANAIKVFIEPGQVTEVRALDVSTPKYKKPHVVSGYFDDPDKLAAAAEIAFSAKGVYFILNPLNPVLLARASNRLRDAGGNPLTSDADIECRRWLLIDLDADRPAGISSTHDEHEAAITKAKAVRDGLREEGWPEPVLADSGNGAHLLYKIDLPVKDGNLVKNCLEALAFRFNDESVKIDQAVHNPARICKLYGTMARKGDDTPERPHRLARLIDIPDKLELVAKQKLEALAVSIPRAEENQKQRKKYKNHGFDIEQWIAEHNMEVNGPFPWKDGRKWTFDVCPWNSAHTNRSAFILEFANGAVAAGCLHNSCRGQNWHSLRDQIEPGWRDKETTLLEPSSSDDVTDTTAFEEPWPEPLDEAAFHGVTGEIVRAIEPHTEADPVALLVQTLVAFGNVIGRKPYFTVDGADHHMNLFAVLVGISSKGRKGTSWAHVSRIFETVNSVWKFSCIKSGMSSGEGLIWSVRDQIVKTKYNCHRAE